MLSPHDVRPGPAAGRSADGGRYAASTGTDPLTEAMPAASAPRGSFEMTPWRARLIVGLVLLMASGVAGNALFQRDKRGRETSALVTGVGPHGGGRTEMAGVPAAATAVEQDMKRWQARLRQLETDAHERLPGDVPSGDLATQSIAGPKPAELILAPRHDTEPVSPVTQQTVRALQRELTDRGYDPGPADGNIGLLTQAAIMAYEHDQGLVLTGEPSERLLRRIVIGASTDEGGPRKGSARDGETAARLIKGVQLALASLNYAPGRTDGTSGEETIRAIREFEMDQGLVPTGRISGRLIIRLARASGKAFVIPVR